MPFALVESSHRGLIIHAVNRCARRQGIRIGQGLADARAALPALTTAPAERTADAAALERLAYWCGRYGPARNIEGADGLWIDVTGVAHLFGGEARLVEDVVTRLGRFGLTVRAGLAETPGAAFALARFACDGMQRWVVASPGGGQAALARLPVEALRLEGESVLLLKRLGLRRIGQLFGLPRAALARRFREPPTGKRQRRRAAQAEAERAAGEVVLRLDQALGVRVELRRPLCEPPVHLVRQLYPDPLLSPAGIEAHCGVLVEQLCAALEAAGEGVRRMRCVLYRSDGTAASVVVGTSQPVRNPIHLAGMLQERIASLDAGFGIDMMTLEAVHVERLAEHQAALLAGQMTEGGVPGDLVDRLSNRLGRERVLRFRAVQSHIPERAWRHVPALDADDRNGPPAVPDEAAGEPPRPALLLSPPERIEVLASVPDGPPVRFAWRRVRRRVVKATGPERIAPEWWRMIGVPLASGYEQFGARSRDYYCIEDETGARFWVFRAGLYGAGTDEPADESDSSPVWFMHGMFV